MTALEMLEALASMRIDFQLHFEKDKGWPMYIGGFVRCLEKKTFEEAVHHALVRDVVNLHWQKESGNADTRRKADDGG